MNDDNIDQNDMDAFKDIKHELGEGSAVNLEEIPTETVDQTVQNDKTESQSPEEIKVADNIENSNSDEDDLIMRQDSAITATLEDQDPEQEIMNKFKNGLNDARPTGAQIHKALKYFDLGIKFEVTMYELQSILNTVSLVELFLFVFTMVFYVRLLAKIDNVWLYIPHFIRGVCGQILSHKMPKSHELIQQLEFDKEQDLMDFETIHKKVKYNMEKTYFGYIKDLEKFFKAYCIVTVISGILDFFNVVIIMHHFGEKGREHEEMFLLIVTLLFWSCNVYYIGYIYLLFYKFPDYILKYITESLFGVGIMVDRRVKKWNDIAQQGHDTVSKKLKSLNKRSSKNNQNQAAEQ